MKMTILLSFVILLGCNPQVIWVKSDMKYSTMKRDTYECERDMLIATRGRFKPEPDIQTGPVPNQADAWRSIGNFGTKLRQRGFEQEFYQRCMEARGYHPEVR